MRHLMWPESCADIDIDIVYNSFKFHEKSTYFVAFHILPLSWFLTPYVTCNSFSVSLSYTHNTQARTHTHMRLCVLFLAIFPHTQPNITAHKARCTSKWLPYITNTSTAQGWQRLCWFTTCCFPSPTVQHLRLILFIFCLPQLRQQHP